MVFSIFNFRPKGKAKCFAGDVGSIGIAFIILFALGRLMLATKDVTYIVFFLVYGIDGSLTIFHRIMLHENLGQAENEPCGGELAVYGYTACYIVRVYLSVS